MKLNTQRAITLLNSSDEDARSLIRQILNALWLDGTYQYQCERSVVPARESARPVLEGAKVLIRADDEDDRTGCALMEDPQGKWVMGAFWGGGALRYIAISKEQAVADAITREACRGKKAAMRQVVDPAQKDLTFWFDGPNGPTGYRRTIAISPWREIIHNYAPSLHAELKALMKLKPEDIAGRNLLLWGPPGTGKTHLLRSLAGEWRNWCSTSYVVDPEKFLNDPSYIMYVMLNGTAGTRNTWNLLIMEDVGELISADARKQSGQGLSRLLNLSDGMLGQGFNVIFAMTTNEPVEALNEAVSRPGRALASLEVAPFTVAEAEKWLGHKLTDPPKHLTLADLYDIRKRENQEKKAA